MILLITGSDCTTTIFPYFKYSYFFNSCSSSICLNCNFSHQKGNRNTFLVHKLERKNCNDLRKNVCVYSFKTSMVLYHQCTLTKLPMYGCGIPLH